MARWPRHLGPIQGRAPERRLRVLGRPHGSHSGPIPPRSRFYRGTFGRLFRNLPPFEASEAQLREIARSMYEPKGAEHDPTLDNPKIPAGYTYLGQFIDHDITFDPTSDLQRRNDPDQVENFRTPSFDLDSIYGRGPEEAPYLYDRGEHNKLLVGRKRDESARELDLLRNPDELAIIGDPRNDENTIVSQLQLAFIMFHNAVVGRLGSEVRFAEAQQVTRWHYQWIVIHDFLERVAGSAIVKEILEGGQRPGRPLLHFYKYRDAPFVPVEFSVAAYRFGHSMIRRAYHLNDVLDHARRTMDRGNIPIFVPRPPKKLAAVADLRGRKSLPSCWTIQWDRFVDLTPGKPPQPSRKIDTKLAPPLRDIPGVRDPAELALRSLMRGIAFDLPSGQSVARAMGTRPIDGDTMPLWYYILREAEVQQQGLRLGAVGGRIVAEVLIGLLAADPQSYLAMDPLWKPTLPSRAGKGKFLLADLLEFAGVPLAAGDLPFNVDDCE